MKGNIGDVQELWNRFKNQIFGYALVEAQFESIMVHFCYIELNFCDFFFLFPPQSFKPSVAEHVSLDKLFEILGTFFFIINFCFLSM